MFAVRKAHILGYLIYSSFSRGQLPCRLFAACEGYELCEGKAESFLQVSGNMLFAQKFAFSDILKIKFLAEVSVYEVNDPVHPIIILINMIYVLKANDIGSPVFV